MLKFFRVPFALSGDRAAVPDPADPGGTVTYMQGYGPDYELPPTNPSNLNVERQKMNQLHFDVTNEMGILQSQGIPDFITSALNGGSPFSYAKNAVVRWTDGNLYTSLVGANTTTPTDPSWALLPTALTLGNTASAAQGAGMTGFNPQLNYAVQTIGWAQRQGAINIGWFVGADPTGATDMTAIMGIAAALGHAIYLPTGTWAMNWAPATRIVLLGDGSTSSLIKPFNTAVAAITYKAPPPNWTYHSEVRDIGFIGTAQVGVGFAFAETVPNNYTAGDELINNVKFYGCRWSGLYQGVLFPSGNIGTEFYSCGWANNFYGVYALNNKFSGSIMHAGCKYFYGGHFSGNTCAIYINNTQDDFGAFSFTDTIIENNVIGFYCKSVTLTIQPLEFRSVWVEANGALQGTSAATLDVWTGSVKSTASFNAHTWYLEGNGLQVNIQGGRTTDIYMSAVKSRVIARDTSFEASGVGAPCTVVDSTSSIAVINPRNSGTYGAALGVTMQGNIEFSSMELGDGSSPQSRCAVVQHRTTKVRSFGNLSSLVSCSYAAQKSYAGPYFSGNGNVLVGAGVTYPNANEFNIPFTSSSTQFVTFPDTTATLSNGWWVITFDVNWIGGAQPRFAYDDGGSNSLFSNISPPTTGHWYTFGSVCHVSTGPIAGMRLNASPNSNASSDFGLQAFQLAYFYTKQEAQDFLQSRVYAEAAVPETVASAASIILPFASTVDISGTTGITSINATGMGGVITTLIFQGALTVTNGSNLKLASNFTTAAGSALTLACDGTNWYEIGRKA